jgi:hypothetical protein
LKKKKRRNKITMASKRPDGVVQVLTENSLAAVAVA